MNALPEVLEKATSTTCGTTKTASATTSLMPVHDTTAPETTSTIFAILPLPIVLHHPGCSSIPLHRWQNDLYSFLPSSTFPVYRSIAWWKHVLSVFNGKKKHCLYRFFLIDAASLSFDRCASWKSNLDRGIMECFMSRALVGQTEKYVRMEDVNNHGNCYPNCWDRINEKIITEKEKNRTHLRRTGHGRGRRSY